MFKIHIEFFPIAKPEKLHKFKLLQITTDELCAATTFFKSLFFFLYENFISAFYHYHIIIIIINVASKILCL